MTILYPLFWTWMIANAITGVWMLSPSDKTETGWMPK